MDNHPLIVNAYKQVLEQISLSVKAFKFQIDSANSCDSAILKINKAKAEKSYGDAVKYMAFTIKKDFTVVTLSNGTITFSGVNFERNFKVAPFKSVLLYFNNINPNDHIKLICQDHLFGNGIIKFNLKDIPLKV